LESDPRNRVAFNQADAVSHEIKTRLSAAPHVMAEPAAQAWDSNVVSHPRFSRRVWISTAVAAAVAVVAFLHFARAPEFQTYTTKVGEHRDVALADGSSIHMNTDTVLSVALSRGTRDVRLGKGEAEFEVAPDAARPFIVDLGTRRVVVVGTAF